MIPKNFYTFNEYMKNKNDLTASEEDYIEMIYRLCEDSYYTRVNDLASSLNVKPPSVSYMLKRLVEKEYIRHVDYGTIELTEKGNTIGKLLYERHYTIEQFLKILGIEDNILEEVEKIEHTLKPETVYAIKHLVYFFNANNDIYKKFHEFRKEINQ